MKVEVAVLGTHPVPNKELEYRGAELRSCMKVEVAVLDTSSLISLMVLWT